MTRSRTGLELSFEQRIVAAFTELLSEKHLYQSVIIEADDLYQSAKQRTVPPPRVHRGSSAASSREILERKAAQHLRQQFEGKWSIHSRRAIHETSERVVAFSLPTIHTFCSACEQRWPFNPIDADSELCSASPTGNLQAFALSYSCQSCKGDPVRFLVKREGYKLQLCGRSPIEVIPAPGFIPRKHRKWHSKAVVAYHAGETLAALFYLRTFIEQFWYTIDAVVEVRKANPRATGEELGQAYMSTLSEALRSEFPSLPDVYDKLSGALHEADENGGLFEESLGKVNEHFDARRLFKM